ncbi:MAG: hypothetical protein ABI625_08630, partial [bacterium]
METAEITNRQAASAESDTAAFGAHPARTLTPDLLQRMNAYWRAANYLSVGQIYLYDNPLL